MVVWQAMRVRPAVFPPARVLVSISLTISLIVGVGVVAARAGAAQTPGPTDLLQSPVSEPSERQPEEEQGTEDRVGEGPAEEGAAEEGAAEDGTAEEGPPEEGPPEEDGEATAESGSEGARPISGDLHELETYRRLWDDVTTRLLLFIPDLLAALLILAALFVVYRASHGVLWRVFERANADPAMASILLKLNRYTLLVLAILMAASQVGIQVGSLLAGIGILGLAVGLAAQESLANLIAGLTLLWDRPFRIGDRVTIADMYGTVEEIGLRSTRVLTLEHLDVILPNREIINRKIINHTRSPQMRLPIAVSIAYAEDTREAREVLLRKIRGHDLIEMEPEPEVVVKELAASGVDLEVRVWLKNPHQERQATFEFTELAKIALDEAGIEIPFPQTTVHYGTGEFPIRLVGGSEADPADGEG